MEGETYDRRSWGGKGEMGNLKLYLPSRGYHAFGIGLLASHDATLKDTPPVKRVAKCKTPQAIVAHLRQVCYQWMTANAKTIVWDGFTLQNLAVHISSDRVTWKDYLSNVLNKHAWADALVIHSLACAFDVDTLILQVGQDPAIVGTSLSRTNADEESPTLEIPLLMVAMVNDRHFWGVVPHRTQLVPADKGEWIPLPAPHAQPEASTRAPQKEHPQPDEGDEESDAEVLLTSIDMQRPAIAEEAVFEELAFCKFLTDWNPWVAPTLEIGHALQSLATRVPGVGSSNRCLVRSEVMADLAYEARAGENIPVHLRYQTVKRRLRNPASGSSLKRCEQLAAVKRNNELLDITAITEALQQPCNRGKQPHTCLLPFRAQPGVVRNWRIMWRSLSANHRREAMLFCMRDSLRTHRESSLPDSTWKHQFKVLGQPVCKDAFRIITGIGSWTLDSARQAALQVKG